MSEPLNSPRISVVLPTHNRPELLAEAVASISAQAYDDWELIVVDDASSPPAHLPEGIRARVIRSESSRGGAESKNRGASMATGDLLAFLDDDDLYAPTYLERAVAVLSENPDLDLVFMGVSWFGERGAAGQRAYDDAMQNLLARLKPYSCRSGALIFDRARLFAGLLRAVPMAFQRPVVRRTSFERIGPYQPDILLWDCDWAIRAALHGNCALVTDGLYLQRAAGQGFSSQHDRRAEHLRSNVLMKERLLQSHLAPWQRQEVCAALAELWFGAAWSSCQNDDQDAALRHLWNSAKIRPRAAHLKLLARIVACRLRRVIA